MPLVTIKKNETTISLLVMRLYSDLDETSREKVEKALKKANPHLTDMRELKPGAVVSLPEIPGIKPKPATVGDDPQDELQTLLMGAVKSYAKITARRMSELQKEINFQQKMLHDDAVIKAIQKQGQVTEDLAKRLKEFLDEQRKTLEQEQSVQKELFEKILDDLKALSQW